MKLLTSIFASIFLLSSLHLFGSTPILRFGLMTDIQYADAETYNNNFYRLSLPKLEEAVEYLNSQEVDFTITLGDMIDRNNAELDLMMKQLGKLKKKAYNIAGNHDYSGFVDNNMLFKKLKMPSEYYSFIQKKWRFIMLNTNEVASYANIEASNKETELKVMKDSIEAQGGTNALPYNGGISNRQMLWLIEELTQAEKKGENVIVCTHHPLFPETDLTALNSKDILNTLKEFKSVKLILSGHDHRGGYGMYENIHSVIVEGMLETETNAYGVVEIYEDKILIHGKDRLSSRELIFE